MQVLEAALELARELGDYAGEHQGVGHDAAPQQTLQEAVRDLGHGANDESGKSNGGKPAIALSGPAGIAAATPTSLTLAAGEHVDSVARQNQQVTAGQKVVINAGSDIGLFAQGGELRQITHQGPMLLQAQKNDIRLEAEQSVEVSASQQHVLVTAKEHITLMRRRLPDPQGRQHRAGHARQLRGQGGEAQSCRSRSCIDQLQRLGFDTVR